MKRLEYIKKIKEALNIHPVAALLGPRQCGKTTLAREYISLLKTEHPKQNYFDLENIEDIYRLENPMLALSQLKGLIVIDEIQRRPELFPTIRVLADDKTIKRKFLVLGSASRDLIKQSSESLAGRIQYIELTPFSFKETKDIKKLWIRGGFPRSYLAKNEKESNLWRESYIQTFLERDIPNLGIQIPPLNLRRFWMMLTHYHGNICNYSEIGRSLSLTHKTVRNYSDILSSTFMMRQLQPWYENISKRQVKSHKLYFRDSGILHSLMGIKGNDDLLTDPKIGASWEGFMLEEVIKLNNARQEECFFWSTQSNAELDLLIVKGNKKFAYEFKYTDHPKITKSMRIALEDLSLDKINIIYPGRKTYKLDEKIQVTCLDELKVE